MPPQCSSLCTTSYHFSYPSTLMNDRFPHCNQVFITGVSCWTIACIHFELAPKRQLSSPLLPPIPQLSILHLLRSISQFFLSEFLENFRWKRNDISSFSAEAHAESKTRTLSTDRMEWKLVGFPLHLQFLISQYIYHHLN